LITGHQLKQYAVSVCVSPWFVGFAGVVFAQISIAQTSRDPAALVYPHFEEESSTSGINHQYTGSWEFFVGGGGAAFDCNGDRMPDVVLAGGSSPVQLYKNLSKPAGELRFESLTVDLSDTELRSVTGAYALHLDQDAHIDLVLLRVGRNVLMRGDGECGFTKANRRFAFDGGREWTTGFSAIWEGESLYPTLAFGNYIDQSAPGSPWGTCHDNSLIRAESSVNTDSADPNDNNSADKNPRYSNNNILSPGYCSLSVLFTDWNNSGEPALRITNDRQYYRGGQEQLWRVPVAGVPVAYGKRDGWKQLTIWGMGIAEADLNSDGFPEYALSSMGDNMLQQLDPEAEEDQPQYVDLAFDQGSTAHRPYEGDDSKPSTGWHTEFADFNNDARLDLFIAKGNVSSMSDFATIDPDNLLLAHPSGGFLEAGAQARINLPTQGRGALVSDFNVDGRMDLLVINREASVSVFRNLGVKESWGSKPLGNWLAIELQQPGVNRQAVGARIVIKTGNLTQTRTVSVGGGHAADSNGFTHVGLGVAERATVRVRWPNGDWSHEYRVFANHHAVLKRGGDKPIYWYPIQ